MSGGHCTHPTGGPAIRLKHKKKLSKMTLESFETSSKSFIIIINFIVKSIRDYILVHVFLSKSAVRF